MPHPGHKARYDMIFTAHVAVRAGFVIPELESSNTTISYSGLSAIPDRFFLKFFRDDSLRRGVYHYLMHLYKILLPLNFNEAFDYFSGDELDIGALVKGPFRSGVKIGVVWGEGEVEVEAGKIKQVIEKLPLPPLPQNLLQFIRFTADYNMAPLGNVLKMALSAKFGAKTFAKQKKLKTANPEHVSRPAWEEIIFVKVPLSPAQEEAAEILNNKVAAHKFSAILLDGVTGSGKTEVYFEAINKALAAKKQVLVLLPEIGLSTQWLQRFQARFGFKPGIWHSDRTEKERRELWLDVIGNRCPLVVGARSALFLPFQNLGLVIIDEEHDQSYKQEEGVIYHGRDMAIIRASLEHIPVILVSATPSIETVNNLQEGKYELVHLPERFGGAEMPKIEVVDMRRQKMPADKFIASKLKDEIANTLASQQQVLLFLNRRGYAPLTLCRACGYRFQCPNCSAWMVMHKARHVLPCHHCDYVIKQPGECPSCHEKDTLHACGPGVERLREEVMEYFPQARVEVMASDSPKSAAEIVNRMLAHELDILIGTQAVAKGHHFAKLSLVGVIDADLGLEGGDLRACERTYQVLHQVSGRAGREEDLGNVILQTFNPENIVIKALSHGSRDEFVENEMLARRRFSMPPFGRLATVTVSGRDERLVKKYITELALNAPYLKDCQLLGPAPAPMAYLRGQHRYRLILKSGKKFNMQKYIKAILACCPTPPALKVKIDIDPFSFV